MAYEIGLPLKNLQNGYGETFLDIKKNYLKITLNPTLPDINMLQTMANAAMGVAAFSGAEDAFKNRMKALLPPGIDGKTAPLTLHVLSEGPYTETFTNTLQNVTLLGMAAEAMMNNSLFKMAVAAKASGINIPAILSDVGRNVLGADNEAMGKLNTNLDKINQATRNGEAGKAVENLLKGTKAENMSSIFSTLTNMMVDMLAKGGKPIFPMVWWDSSFSAGYNFSVRLYNPNPANKQYHIDRIITPLAALEACVLPSGLGSNSGLTYESPLYFDILCPGLFRLPSVMITNMSVVKGGDDNAIAFNHRPGVIDVRFTITPVYDKRLILANKEADYNQYQDFEEMMLERDKSEPDSVRPQIPDTNIPNNTNNQTDTFKITDAIGRVTQFTQDVHKTYVNFFGDYRSPEEVANNTKPTTTTKSKVDLSILNNPLIG